MSDIIEIPISRMVPLIVQHYMQHIIELEEARQQASKLGAAIRTVMKVGQRTSLMFSGPSGAGKSESVFQAYDILKKHYEKPDKPFGILDFRPSAHESVDLTGMPAPDLDAMLVRWLKTDLLPREGGGILLIDEITSTPKPMQAALYRLLQTPEDFGVPPEWFIVCAGNRAEDRGVNVPLAGPVVARVRWYDVYPTLGDPSDPNSAPGYLQHAIADGTRPEVLSFLRDRPDYLYNLPPKGAIRPFPNPRGWSRLSRGLSMAIPDDLRMATFAGDVGTEAAIAFEAHLRIYGQGPRIDDILEGKVVEVPTLMDVLYCCAMGLAYRVTRETFDNVDKFLEQCPGEIQTLCVKLAFKRDKEIAKAARYAQWSIRNQEAFQAV